MGYFFAQPPFCSRSKGNCLYMLALGYMGLGIKEKAMTYLSEVESLDNNHQGVRQLRSLIDMQA